MKIVSFAIQLISRALVPWIWTTSLFLGNPGRLVGQDQEREETAIPPLIEATWKTQEDARMYSRLIPAPRGQIVDRNGYPLAQSRMSYRLQLDLPRGRDIPVADVVAFVDERMARLREKLKVEWELEPQQVIQHFKNRRWDPLTVSPILTDQQVERFQSSEVAEEFQILPIYLRYYPEKETAAHIIGYVGRESSHRKMSELEDGEPVWPEIRGRDGLELTMNSFLSGKAGERVELFSPEGEKLLSETIRDPVVGNHLVTTLDLQMQKLAEDALKFYCKKGAFVVIDLQTGDILAMASRPSFDLNLFVPFIEDDEFKKLNENPALPLYGRAFRGLYPPASTFKVSVALSALQSKKVARSKTYRCSVREKIDGRWFHNHSRRDEGWMSVVEALSRSCNTWFYQAALDMGGEPIVDVAEQLGIGQKTEIPLNGEPSGFMPSNSRLLERYGYPLAGGYLANTSIGQGHVLTSPLQVAQMMAGIGNGKFLPKLRLVRQVQDSSGNVLEYFPLAYRRALDFDPRHIGLVTRGMREVVHGASGTGRAGANPYELVAGKTGTAQWGNLSERKYLAWFAGFTPANAPRYAFAAVYEGSPGQLLSGGKQAAPMAGYFFRMLYRFHHENYLKSLNESLPTLPEEKESYLVETNSAREMEKKEIEIRRALPLKSAGG